MTTSTGRKAANNERLRAICKDGARQSAVAKRNTRRHAFNGVGPKAQSQLKERANG